MKPSDSDLAIFAEKGILHLKNRAPKKQVEKIKLKINTELERLKLKVGGKFISSKFQKMPVFQQTAQLSQMVRVGPELDEPFSNELISYMTALVDSKLKLAHPHPQLLLSFPQKDEWNMDHLNWHLDIAVPKKDIVPGVQAFLLIDDLKPKGGATLALSGSHRLHYVSADNDARNSLSKIDSKFFQAPQSVNGIQISVVEMSGNAGDIFLMDMRTLHTPSINISKNMRMMATNRFIR